MSSAWELAQALGLGAVAGCLILCVLAVRPRAGATGAFGLRAHELFGWLILTAAIVHVGLLLVVDRTVLEHLKPTAPRYEYAGIVALLVLLFLTVPAGASVRSRLWQRHRSFQAAHVAAACLLVVTLAIHVLATDRYVHGRAAAIAYTLLSGIALLALLRGRSQRAPVAGRPLLSALVFGRHSRLVLAIVLASLVALLALTRSGTALALREPLLLHRSERMVVNFPHDKHRAVNCLECHHDFEERLGAESCVSCHRSARTDLKYGAEARFHVFCLRCHRDPPANLTGHGPVTGCDTCHAPLSTAASPAR